MLIVAIDPGTTQSALVLYDTDTCEVLNHMIEDNFVILEAIDHDSGTQADMLVIEDIECMGMAVGRETFETVRWTGRFDQAWRQRSQYIRRSEVKLHLCGTKRAKDANVRQAILDRFGGRQAIGVKKSPGPLYGIRSHEWQALALALTFADLRATGTPAASPSTI